ncbi:MAG: Mur ligase family protein, partial [Planctomycetia bacterium]
NANLSTGGTAIDVTAAVHHEVAARAVEAARIVGLDVAGIDIVAADVTRPLEDQHGVVVEVNASPGLRMHVQPSVGQSQAVGPAIVEHLFPNGDDGRIPIVGVTGVNGKTTTTRFIAHILRGTGKRVGMTCTDGIYIEDRRIDMGDCSGPQSARNVLMNPAVEAAVFETARGGILREGLGFDRCDVAVVTNIGEGDHLGLADVHTTEKLAQVKRTLVEAVAATGAAVLNAADALTAGMAEYCPGRVVYFAVDDRNAVIAAHREKGGRALFVRDNVVVLAEGATETDLVSLDRVPLTYGGRVPFQVENTLAAIGAAWSLGLPLDLLRNRVQSFTANMEQVPGRFNVIELHGATVIVDYGHNPSALQALVGVIEKLPNARRRTVYSAAGDRRDVDMIRQGELLGRAFHQVVLYEDQYIRGRAEGEISRLIRQGIDSVGAVGPDGVEAVPGPRLTEEVVEVRGALKAVETALKSVRPGDLLLVQADEIDTTVNFIREYLSVLANAATEPAPAPMMPTAARNLQSVE